MRHKLLARAGAPCRYEAPLVVGELQTDLMGVGRKVLSASIITLCFT